MKKVLLILIITCSAINLYSQKWDHVIGDPNTDESCKRIIEHYDHGYLITGYYSEEYNDQHGWLVKTDINGNILWHKKFAESPDKVLIEKTIFDNEGNLYIVGTLVQNIASNWPVILKLNPCGELIWCRKFYYEEMDYGYFTDLILLKNGDLLGLANIQSSTQNDIIFLICISSEGDYLWKQSYASKDDYPLFDMRSCRRIKQFDDIFIVSGYVYSPHPDNPAIVSLRPMFIGIDSLFNEQWVLEFGLEDNKKGKAYETIQISDSVFMGIGINRYSEDGNSMGNTFLMFFDKDGTELSYNIIPNEDFNPDIKQNFLTSIERIDDTVFIGTGFIGYDYQGSPCGEMIIDTSGNIYNYKIRDGHVGTAHLTKTFDNKYTIATSTIHENLTWDIYLYKVNENLENDTVYPGVYTYDSLCNNLPIQSGTIDLTGCGIITSMDEIPTLEDYNDQQNKIEISVFPNPSNKSTTTLSFSSTTNFNEMELRCYNIFGEKVHQEKVYQHQGETKINIQNWQSGIYIALIYSDGQIVGRTKFVVQ